MAKVKVGKVSEVKEGEVNKVDVDGQEIALFNLDGKVFGLQNECSHVGCNIDENHKIEGEEVECTCHGSKFNIKTGEVTMPPATEPMKVYKVTEENGEIFVEK